MDLSSQTLCDKVCQSLVASRWFSIGTLVSSTNKTDLHDIAGILLKVALNTIIITIQTLSNLINQTLKDFICIKTCTTLNDFIYQKYGQCYKSRLNNFINAKSQQFYKSKILTIL